MSIMNPLAATASVLVISCDRYADLWRPFFEVFWKRWPDCPFTVFLGSNALAFDDARVKTIRVGPDRSWAENVHRMLDSVAADYVLLFLEDFLIRQPVETARIVDLVSYCARRDIDCARLAPLPAPTPLPPAPLGDYSDFGRVPPRAPYRVSAQAALWRVDALRHYLVAGFTPWEFEHMGTQMSRYAAHTFIGPFKPLIDYDHGVEKGLWKPEGLAICTAAGVTVDRARRAAFTDETLRAHHARGMPASDMAAIKIKAMDAFHEGRRRDALRHALRYLRARPLALDVYAIVIFGLAGPHAIAWLHRQHLRLRLGRIRRRAIPDHAGGNGQAACAE
jgi:hypothetical protein